MKCSECPYRMVPFFYCEKLKMPISDGKTTLEGCNLPDGKLPPLRTERHITTPVSGRSYTIREAIHLPNDSKEEKA